MLSSRGPEQQFPEASPRGAWMRNRVDKVGTSSTPTAASGAGPFRRSWSDPGRRQYQHHRQAVEYPDQRGQRMRPSCTEVHPGQRPASTPRARAGRAAQRSISARDATLEVATEVIRRRESSAQSQYAAYAHRTEVHPGASAKSVPSPPGRSP